MKVLYPIENHQKNRTISRQMPQYENNFLRYLLIYTVYTNTYIYNFLICAAEEVWTAGTRNSIRFTQQPHETTNEAKYDTPRVRKSETRTHTHTHKLGHKTTTIIHTKRIRPHMVPLATSYTRSYSEESFGSIVVVVVVFCIEHIICCY